VGLPSSRPPRCSSGARRRPAACEGRANDAPECDVIDRNAAGRGPASIAAWSWDDACLSARSPAARRVRGALDRAIRARWGAISLGPAWGLRRFAQGGVNFVA
jgi:hypothetical protein